MATATAITGAVAVGASLYQSYEGKKREREAEKEIENYQRQELQNAYADVQVSQLGANLRREELARSQATSTDALRAGGVRGLVGGLGQVQAQGTQVSRDIAANLDQQQKQIDFARAQDDTQIRQIQEQRENADLAGLGQAVEVGRQDFYGGIQQGLSAGFNTANAYGLQKGRLKGEPEGAGAANQFSNYEKQEVGSLLPEGIGGLGGYQQPVGGLGYQGGSLYDSTQPYGGIAPTLGSRDSFGQQKVDPFGGKKPIPSYEYLR